MRTNALQKQTKYMTHTHMTKPNQMHANTSQKPYYDAGLKAMAQSVGYPLPAIQACSQFKRTHCFILEAWEAVYRAMILKFEEVNPTMNFLNNQAIQDLPTDYYPLHFQNYLAIYGKACVKS